MSKEKLEREVAGLKRLCVYLVSVMDNQLNMDLDHAPMEGTEKAERFVESFFERKNEGPHNLYQRK